MIVIIISYISLVYFLFKGNTMDFFQISGNLLLFTEILEIIVHSRINKTVSTISFMEESDQMQM